MTNSSSLSRDFYAAATLTVAEALLGKVLVHSSSEGTVAGTIVETEAYIGQDDPACHAATGLTKRNAPMYGPPGKAYIYLNYGVHSLLNAVTEKEGFPAAVLIRALEPLSGVDLMRRRRVTKNRDIAFNNLCRGPGNLTRALGITLTENGLDLTGRRLRIENRGIVLGTVAHGPRVGIRVATDRPWRCWIDEHPCVSR